MCPHENTLGDMKLWRGEPDHPYWKTPFSPKEKALVALGLGAGFLLLGAYDWLNPRVPPFSGRWSWVSSWAYYTLGTHGPAALEGGLGLLMVLAGCLQMGATSVRAECALTG